LKQWLFEPLVQFLLLGALIFVGHSWLSSDVQREGQIQVSRGQQEHLLTTFARTWTRPPTAKEFEGLVDDWIREEIAYREGTRMGLDTDDTIIRRRLRQKLELLAEDVVSVTAPGEEELAAFLASHQQDYRLETRLTFSQIYFSEARRGAQAHSDAVKALNQIQEGWARPLELGDPLPLPARFSAERESAIAGQLGQDFAQGLGALELARWVGPIRSAFGLHLVHIEAREAGRPLTLDEARNEVKRDWEHQRRIETIEQLYARLRDQYTVIVEPLSENNPGGATP
jgi:hypothetical protein